MVMCEWGVCWRRSDWGDCRRRKECALDHSVLACVHDSHHKGYALYPLVNGWNIPFSIHYNRELIR